MPIDPSIAIRAGQRGWSLGDIIQQREQGDRQDQQLQMQQQRFEAEQAERTRQEQARGALANLITNRGPNGQIDTHSPQFNAYAQNDPSGAFAMLDKMDERQRAAVKAGTDDLAAAVQWADTPDKWAVVQRHIAQADPQIAQTPFEHRQEVLVHLGQMGEYLKNTAPKIMGIEAGGSVAAVDPMTGQPKFTVLPNPGDQAAGAPAQGGIREGATATNPQTGQKIMFQNGQWVPVAGGAGSNASGNFR